MFSPQRLKQTQQTVAPSLFLQPSHNQLYCITVLSPRIFIKFSRECYLLPLDTLICFSKLNINPPYVVAHSIICCIQLGEHVVHPCVDVCGNLIERLSLNLLTLPQLLHHHTQILQLIWWTVRGSWSSLLIAL